MSSPNKNSQRKEVIFKSSIFLSLLLFSILIASYLARGTPPQTTDAAELNQYYAYSYDTADKLAAKLKSSATDHYGRTWKSYGASVDTSKRHILAANGKKIDLTTLCNGKKKGDKGWEHDKETIPFRYYFWVKPAKIRSTDTYYHTQKFVATIIYEAQNKGQVKVQKAYYDHTDESETDGISSYEKVEEDE